EGDFLRRLGLRLPDGQRFDVVGPDAEAVLRAQQVLQEDLQGERQRSCFREALEDGVEAMDGVAPVADIEDGLAAERVAHGGVPSPRRECDCSPRQLYCRTKGIPRQRGTIWRASRSYSADPTKMDCIGAPSKGADPQWVRIPPGN